MEYAKEYSKFCEFVVTQKLNEQVWHDLVGGLVELNDAILGVLTNKDQNDLGVKLQRLEVSAKTIRCLVRQKSLVRPSSMPRCLEIFSQALRQSDLASTVARQCGTVAIRFPLTNGYFPPIQI